MSSFPKKKKKYQKVPLAPTADDDDGGGHSLQLATLPSSSSSSLRTLPDDTKTPPPLPSPLPPPRAYTALSAACSQLLRHRRLPLILRRAQLIVEGYRRKRDGRLAPFNAHSLADLASTVLDEGEGVTLMDYLVKQVYTVDLPTDPYTQSPSAPSLLSSLTLLPLASVTPLPPPTHPPDPLHTPTASLLTSTVAYLFPPTGGSKGEQVSAAECLAVLRRFVDDWKYSERKLGLKVVEEEEGGEEVENLDGWLEGSTEGDEELVEEDEGETMSMRDFLGGAAPDIAEDEEEEEEKGEEVRIDVRRRVDRHSRALEEEEEEEDDDEVQLEDLKLDDEEEDEDG